MLDPNLTRDRHAICDDAIRDALPTRPTEPRNAGLRGRDAGCGTGRSRCSRVAGVNARRTNYLSRCEEFALDQGRTVILRLSTGL
jgi:hypothetical protein